MIVWDWNLGVFGLNWVLWSRYDQGKVKELEANVTKQVASKMILTAYWAGADSMPGQSWIPGTQQPLQMSMWFTTTEFSTCIFGLINDSWTARRNAWILLCPKRDANQTTARNTAQFVE